MNAMAWLSDSEIFKKRTFKIKACGKQYSVYFIINCYMFFPFNRFLYKQTVK